MIGHMLLACLSLTWAGPLVGVKLNFSPSPHGADLEIRGSKDGQLHDIRTGNLVLKLSPGDYEIRTRSHDDRGVAGEWSDWQPLKIKPKSVKLEIKPQEYQAHPQSRKARVKLQWPAADGAQNYRVTLSSDSQQARVQETEKHLLELDLPPGNYRWSLVSVANNGLESSSSNAAEFRVLGPQLSKPKIEQVNTKHLSIMAPEAQTLLFKFEYSRFESTHWNETKPESLPITQGTTALDLPQNLSPGRYRISMWTKADHWLDSETSVLEFEKKPLATSLPAPLKTWSD